MVPCLQIEKKGKKILIFRKRNARKKFTISHSNLNKWMQSLLTVFSFFRILKYNKRRFYKKGTRVLYSHWLKDQWFKDFFNQRSGKDDIRHEKWREPLMAVFPCMSNVFSLFILLFDEKCADLKIILHEKDEARRNSLSCAGREVAQSFRNCFHKIINQTLKNPFAPNWKIELLK